MDGMCVTVTDGVGWAKNTIRLGYARRTTTCRDVLTTFDEGKPQKVFFFHIIIFENV